MGVPASHTTVAKYETGKSVSSLLMLDALAAIYERSREWFFNRGSSFGGVRYRALKSVRVVDKRRFEGESLGWFLAYFAAEKKVNDPVDCPKGFEISADESGARVARQIRNYYKFQDLPIPSIVRLTENFGIHVIQVESEARIDGFSAMLGEVPVVVVNSKLSNDRIRMNVAHELSRHLFRNWVRGKALRESEIEKRAMECASHLLIPDAALEAAFALRSMIRLVQYKERYGISLAGMMFRARQSKLLDEGVYQRLRIEFRRLGWGKEEPGCVPPDRPTRMESLFEAAIQQRLLRLGEIAALAAADERVVLQRLVLAKGGTIGSTHDTRPFNPLRIDYVLLEQSDLKGS